MTIQFIETEGIKTHVILPLSDYEDMIDSLELARGQIDDQGETFPLEIVKRLYIANENPLKVFREWRDMTQAMLADQTGLSKNFISMLERGERSLTKATAIKLAKALHIEWDDLLHTSS